MSAHDLSFALDRNDLSAAQLIATKLCDQMIASNASPHEAVYISAYAMRSGDIRIRDPLATIATEFQHTSNDLPDYSEGTGLTYYHLGMSFLSTKDEARKWLSKCLDTIPNFLPAQVELAVIDKSADRHALFGWISDDAPNRAAFYEFAAAQIGLSSADAPSRKAEPKMALALRGQCDGRTIAFLRFYRRAFPEFKIYLSTWKHTNPEILSSVHALCDGISAEPEVGEPGFGNRLRQLCLATAVLDLCKADNELVLLARTDMVLMKRNLPTILHRLWQTSPLNSPHMKGHIILSSLYTRKYMPDHFSDLFMFGAVDEHLGLLGYVSEVPHSSRRRLV